MCCRERARFTSDTLTQSSGSVDPEQWVSCFLLVLLLFVFCFFVFWGGGGGGSGREGWEGGHTGRKPTIKKKSLMRVVTFNDYYFLRSALTCVCVCVCV